MIPGNPSPDTAGKTKADESTPHAGLLGGSFDPVHLAHLALARAAREALQLDWVELLPAGEPWQRPALGASSGHRLNMLQIACENESAIRINTIELQRAGPSYTIDTLLQLPRDIKYTWILGSDQLNNFCTWHRWQEIIHIVRLAVALRPGSELDPPAGLLRELPADGMAIIPFEPSPISATAIRTALAHGKPVANMLDERVLEYVHRHRLYQ